MAQQKANPPISEPLASAFQPSDWEDADFIRALASLERLQQQLDQIRKVPTNLVTPFRTTHTRQQVFSSFNTARLESFQQITELRTAWEEPKTAQLFQQCSRTQEKHVDLVQQHDIGIWGWNEREQELETGHNNSNGVGAATADVNGKASTTLRNTEEDEKTASALFGPEFKRFEWDESHSQASITVERPGPWLSFEVKRKRTADGVAYEARCVDDTKEAEAISRCLHNRIPQQDIFETLETLLAYGDVALSRADCSKCGRYRDSTGATPSARLRRPKVKMPKQDTDETAAWTALHEGCL